MAIVMTTLSSSASQMATPTAQGDVRYGANGAPWMAIPEYDAGPSNDLAAGRTQWDSDLSDGFDTGDVTFSMDYKAAGATFSMDNASGLSSDAAGGAGPIGSVDLRAFAGVAEGESKLSGITITFKKLGVTTETITVGNLDAVGTDSDSNQEDLAEITPAASDNDEVIITATARMLCTQPDCYLGANDLFCQALIYA